MMESSLWVLKVILSRFPDSEREQLERFLSTKEKEELQSVEKPEVDIEIEETPLLDRLHWSWLLPEMQNLSQKEQKLFLGAFPHATRENLCRELNITSIPKDTNKIVKEFVQHSILQHLATEKLLPVYCLPPNPISDLLKLDKQKFVSLIDTLALSDLAAELKQIVETKILKKIYSFFSVEEMKYLKKAAANFSQQSRLDLKKWDGTEKSLRNLLHKRGLAKLAVALHSQHPDFIWYVCHQLDIGRGSAVEKIAAQTFPPMQKDDAIHQIQEIIKGLA